MEIENNGILSDIGFNPSIEKASNGTMPMKYRPCKLLNTDAPTGHQSIYMSIENDIKNSSETLSQRTLFARLMSIFFSLIMIKKSANKHAAICQAGK